MEYSSYFLLIPKYLLIIVGLWPNVNSYKLFYFIHSIIIKSCFIFFFVTFCIGFIVVLPSLSTIEIADSMTYILAYGLVCWKMWFLSTDGVKQILQHVFVYEQSILNTGSELERIYKNQWKKNIKVISYLPFVLVPCYLSFVVAVLLDYINWKNMEAKGLPSDRHLIFPELLPKPEKYFTLYYIFQVSCGGVGGLYLAFVDSLVISLINFTTTRFKMLKFEMEHFFSDKGRSSIQTQQDLKNIIKKHQSVIKIVQDINKLFRWVFFIDFTSKSYHISLVMVSLFDVTLKTTIPWLIFKVSQLCVLFLQAGVVYLLAYQLTIESEEFGTSIYKSDWIGQPITTIQLLLIMTMRTRKPLKYESFGIVILSNSLILKIIQAAYTYVVFNLSNIKKTF